MASRRQLEFFLLRYVPDGIKGEFVNIGVVMFEPGTDGAGFADVRFTRDWRRVRCLDPDADIAMLQALEREIRLQFGNAQDREKVMLKLQDSFSNVVQLSSGQGCLAEEPAKEIEMLSTLYLEAPHRPTVRLTSSRQQILGKMREAFEQAGVWKLLTHGIPVAPYTRSGDPLKFDFGYRVGNTIKFFHAISLKASVDQAVTLASRYPAIASSMATLAKAHPFLTAVVDDGLDRHNEQIEFALGMLEEAKVRIASPPDMPAIAEVARQELLA